MKMKKITVLCLSLSLIISGCGPFGNKQNLDDSSSVSGNSVSGNSVSGNSVSGNAIFDALEDDAFAGNTDEDPSADAAGDQVPIFQSQDLSGNEVTRDIFKGKDVTMVNVWGTFCPPCIAEMPELEKIAASLPENAQLVGFVCDVPLGYDTGLETAKEIVEDSGVTYSNILPDDEIMNFLSQFMYVPTTFFVDGDGSLIGEPIVGADTNAYVQRLMDLLPGYSYGE
ncbi:MAG: TlpA family protein disulfide reductase [Lachnospiraceae bacterium]|nr:TlpA family protein disulfide reductase [Lachnospiraceae bacterium]